MSLHRLAMTVAGLALAGCSTLGEEQFACPGFPGQPMCLPASSIYAATEHADAVRPAPGGDLSTDPSLAGAPAVAPAPVEHRPLPVLDGPLPVRTPAMVMRIWIAPWQDEAGDLHVPGYVYTEVEARRWTLGDAATGTGAVLAPLQVQHRAPPRPDGSDQPAATTPVTRFTPR